MVIYYNLSPDVEPNGAGVFGDHSSSLQGGGVAEEEQVMLAPQVSVVSPQDYDRESGAAAAYTDEDCENKCHSHFHDTVGQVDSKHHHHHDYCHCCYQWTAPELGRPAPPQRSLQRRISAAPQLQMLKELSRHSLLLSNY